MTALDDRPLALDEPDLRADLTAAHRTIGVVWAQAAEAERQVGLRDARLAEVEAERQLRRSIAALAPWALRQNCVGGLDDWVAATAERDWVRCDALRRGRRSDPPRFCTCKGHPHAPTVRYADGEGSRA